MRQALVIFTMILFGAFAQNLDLDNLAIVAPFMMQYLSSLSLNITPQSAHNNNMCFQRILEFATNTSDPAFMPFIMNTGKGLNDLGDYDSCLTSSSNVYIALHIERQPICIAFGFCFPKECRPEHFSTMKQSIAETLTSVLNDMKGNKSQVNMSVTADNVRFVDPVSARAEQGDYSLMFFVTLLIFAGFLVICIIATIISRIKEQKKDVTIPHKLLRCFNLDSNWKKLTENERTDEDKDLKVFDGLRVLGIIWVIAGHTFYYAEDTPLVNPDGITDFTEQFWNAFIYNGTLSVDVFFFLGAFLASYLIMKKFKGKPQISLQMYIHRIVRFYPGILVSLGVFCFIIPYIANGPLYHRFFDKVNNDCAQLWYKILLFVANFRPWHVLCIDYVWYICLDMQLFLITPFILLLYSKRKLFGALVPIAIILANIGVTIPLALHYNIWASPARYNSNFEEIYYEKPYTRAGVYMIGLLAGLFYYEAKEGRALTPSNLLQFIGDHMYIRGILYLAGFMLMFWVIHLMYWMDKYPESISRAQDLLYLLFYRDFFAIGLFLFVLPVLAGKGRLMKLLLGNHAFFVMGKLSYGGYMLHQLFMEYYEFIKTKPMFWSRPHLYMNVWGYGFLAFIAAAIMFLFIEQPLFNLERFLFSCKKSTSKVEENDEERILNKVKESFNEEAKKE